VVKPGGIIQVNQDPTTVLLGVGVIGALFGIVAIRRASKSRKAAREARRQLQKIMKTRREQGIAEPTQGGAGGPLAQGPSSPPKPSR
jgi:type II secretory pathway pseudopilin PulG